MSQGQSYIYARVSTSEQNVEQQVSHLKTLSPNAIVYKEHCSGKTLDREEFNKLKKAVHKGDRITVLSVSRLGRNTVEVLQFIEDMKDRGVAVCVADLGGIDVCSPMGKLVLTTLAAVAEMQREEILDKQRIGIERAKAEGKYKGKQQSAKTVKACEGALRDIARGLSKEKAAKANGVGIATLYRYIKDTKGTPSNGHQQGVSLNQGDC
ncbi:resolvase [Photobacterium damselae]|uniref:Recombinase family protein n=2 Tax=Photobacterium damselae TaxID=38293 RepID=A0ABD6X6S5_PHODM|nr:resolvase [Photobacterium damselae]PSU18277.1 recombinase family protein [Photobacterium damselae]